MRRRKFSFVEFSEMFCFVYLFYIGEKIFRYIQEKNKKREENQSKENGF